MFDRLITSKTSGTVSVLVHAGVWAAAVLATLHPHRVAGLDGPPIVISWPQPSQIGDRFDPVPGPGAPPIDVPPQSPIGLPPIDARAPFDPKVLLRGVSEAPGDHGVDGAPEGPWSPIAVDEPPVLLAGPPLGYPDVLRRAGTTGTVTVQLVIDTLGRAEPGSLVLQSSHPGFEAAARVYVVGALFRPGRAHGRAVRVLVRLPISFTLRPPR